MRVGSHPLLVGVSTREGDLTERWVGRLQWIGITSLSAIFIVLLLLRTIQLQLLKIQREKRRNWRRSPMRCVIPG